MTVHQATPSNFATLLKSAVGGDEIVCANGDYGDTFQLTSKTYSSPLVIRATEKWGARWPRIKVIECANMELVDLNAESGNLYCVQVDKGQNIKFRRPRVHTTKVGGKAVYATGISGFEFTDFYLSQMSDDGIHLSGVKDFVIANGDTSGIFLPQPGAHIDFLQMRRGCSRGQIFGNVFLAKSHANAQGIFWDDVEGSERFDDLEVWNNIIATGMANGIRSGSSVNSSNSSGCKADHNTLATIPGVHDNCVVNIVGEKSENIECGGTKARFDAYYLGGPTRLGMTIEDFRPKPGTAGETSGAYERIDQLLDEDGTDPGPDPEPPDPEPTPEPVTVNIAIKVEAAPGTIVNVSVDTP